MQNTYEYANEGITSHRLFPKNSEKHVPVYHHCAETSMHRGFQPRYMFAQHIPYHIPYGISMVHPQLTYTMPQTLYTSRFRRGNGIWVYDLCLKHKNSRNLPIPSSYGRWYSSLRLGFMGNHPLSTRFFCSKSSRMLHRHEQPITPSTGLMI